MFDLMTTCIEYMKYIGYIYIYILDILHIQERYFPRNELIRQKKRKSRLSLNIEVLIVKYNYIM